MLGSHLANQRGCPSEPAAERGLATNERPEDSQMRQSGRGCAWLAEPSGPGRLTLVAALELAALELAGSRLGCMSRLSTLVERLREGRRPPTGPLTNTEQTTADEVAADKSRRDEEEAERNERDQRETLS
jgi:hypothetical protein